MDGGECTNPDYGYLVSVLFLTHHPPRPSQSHSHLAVILHFDGRKRNS